MEELDKGWQVIQGNKPVLLMASHNLALLREGKIEPADMGTGEMVRKLCEKYGFWGMVTTREIFDPNWYLHSPFRDEVRKIIRLNFIKLIIDIHGKRMEGENLIEYYPNNMFMKKKLTLPGTGAIKKFTMNKQMTVCEEFNNDLPAIQLEIRDDGGEGEKYLEAQKIIEDFIESLEQVKIGNAKSED